MSRVLEGDPVRLRFVLRETTYAARR